MVSLSFSPALSLSSSLGWSTKISVNQKWSSLNTLKAYQDSSLSFSKLIF
ncbi:unnamed protein product [Meloidogyne enterolobii]|uniref:Uncharacterized protein n=1 Tax=Meloidogyne enterolobii TaxID=390850 RepID=A0ACB0ZX27_MELEN